MKKQKRRRRVPVIMYDLLTDVMADGILLDWLSFCMNRQIKERFISSDKCKRITERLNYKVYGRRLVKQTRLYLRAK